MESIIDVLLDEENTDPIRLADENGREIVFDQIAVIPYADKLYCVLKPITRIEGVAADEAIVFYVDETSGEAPCLKVERDELTAMSVFEEYYDLLEEKGET